MENSEKISDYWGEFHNRVGRPKLSWLESDEIISYVNKRVTGNENTSFYENLKKYKKGKYQKALIVGCGSGQLERDLIRGDFIDYALSVDISKDSIELAKKSAEKESLSDKLEYKVFDLERENYKTLGMFDIVIVCMVAHHVKKLDKFFLQLNQIMLPSGLIVLNEYIGPNRFWHDDAVVGMINKLLSAIDDKYKYNHLTGTGELRTSYVRTPLSHFLANDPSEAINSAKIIETINKYFNILENKSYGGQINHMLLTGIVENFSNTIPDKNILRLLMVFEEILENAGVISSDFAFIIARPKSINWFNLIKNFFK